jgi:hypothetical protein
MEELLNKVAEKTGLPLDKAQGTDKLGGMFGKTS